MCPLAQTLDHFHRYHPPLIPRPGPQKPPHCQALKGESTESLTLLPPLSGHLFKNPPPPFRCPVFLRRHLLQRPPGRVDPNPPQLPLTPLLHREEWTGRLCRLVMSLTFSLLPFLRCSLPLMASQICFRPWALTSRKRSLSPQCSYSRWVDPAPMCPPPFKAFSRAKSLASSKSSAPARARFDPPHTFSVPQRPGKMGAGVCSLFTLTLFLRTCIEKVHTVARRSPFRC